MRQNLILLSLRIRTNIIKRSASASARETRVLKAGISRRVAAPVVPLQKVKIVLFKLENVAQVDH